MLSILFGILTGDDRLDDASDMLWFLLNSIMLWFLLKLGRKTDFLAHFDRFVYALLHPMSYAPRFFSNKISN